MRLFGQRKVAVEFCESLCREKEEYTDLDEGWDGDPWKGQLPLSFSGWAETRWVVYLF